jgi:rhodanese-related sulfurtransferase
MADKTAEELVAAAKARIENLTVDQVVSEREDGKPVIVDLRESEERVLSGFIPGALHIPRGLLEFYADPKSSYYRSEIAPDRRVILHCSGGGRSALAVCTLQDLGYANVAHLDGGFDAWKAADQPVEVEDAGD